MANSCEVIIKAVGSQSSVQSFSEMIKNGNVFVGYGCEPYIEDVEKNGEFSSVSAYGICKYSIKSSLRCQESGETLEKVSERLRLKIEAFSSEPGCGFQEHFLVENGEVRIDDCVDYREIALEDFESADFNWGEMSRYGINSENYLNNVNEDGYVAVGGYDNFGEFQI